MIKIEENQNVFVHLLQSDFLQHDLRELMNRIQTLFLKVDNHRDIQATLAIVRLSLPTRSKEGDLRKKKYLWNPSLLLHSFGCGGLEIDEQ